MCLTTGRTKLCEHLGQAFCAVSVRRHGIKHGAWQMTRYKQVFDLISQHLGIINGKQLLSLHWKINKKVFKLSLPLNFMTENAVSEINSQNILTLGYNFSQLPWSVNKDMLIICFMQSWFKFRTTDTCWLNYNYISLDQGYHCTYHDLCSFTAYKSSLCIWKLKELFQFNLAHTAWFSGH